MLAGNERFLSLQALSDERIPMCCSNVSLKSRTISSVSVPRNTLSQFTMRMSAEIDSPFSRSGRGLTFRG